MNTLDLEHFQLAVYLNGKWVGLGGTYGYSSTMDMIIAIRIALRELGAGEPPVMLTVNGEHTLETTLSKADEAINNWCDIN
jgi:hypothetical protein